MSLGYGQIAYPVKMDSDHEARVNVGFREAILGSLKKNLLKLMASEATHVVVPPYGSEIDEQHLVFRGVYDFAQSSCFAGGR